MKINGEEDSTENFIRGDLFLVILVTENGVKYRGKNKGVLVQPFGYLRCL